VTKNAFEALLPQKQLNVPVKQNLNDRDNKPVMFKALSSRDGTVSYFKTFGTSTSPERKGVRHKSYRQAASRRQWSVISGQWLVYWIGLKQNAVNHLWGNFDKATTNIASLWDAGFLGILFSTNILSLTGQFTRRLELPFSPA